MGAGHDHSHGPNARASRMIIAAAVLSVFFVIELKSPIHERGRLVFWDGQDRHNSIAGRLRERLATYRAAQAAAG